MLKQCLSRKGEAKAFLDVARSDQSPYGVAQGGLPSRQNRYGTYLRRAKHLVASGVVVVFEAVRDSEQRRLLRRRKSRRLGVVSSPSRPGSHRRAGMELYFFLPALGSLWIERCSYLKSSEKPSHRHHHKVPKTMYAASCVIRHPQATRPSLRCKHPDVYQGSVNLSPEPPFLRLLEGGAAVVNVSFLPSISLYNSAASSCSDVSTAH